MIGRIPYPLSMHTQLQKPAVAAGVTWSAYLDVLEKCVGDSNENVSLNLFRRWCKVKGFAAQQAGMNENTVEEFALAFGTEILRTEKGRAYGPSVVRQAPTDVRGLHNRVFAHDKNICVRELLPRLVARKLFRFAELTPQTQTALAWFEVYGCSPGKNSGRPVKPLTTATRVKSTYAAILLLDELGKNGLEQIKEVDLPELSADDPDYRRQSELRHKAATVYRCCVAKELLPENPLIHATNETFSKQARRDFLAPEQLKRLLDLSSVDRKNFAQVTDRLVMLMYLDLGLRKNELAAVRFEDVREISPGKFQVTLDNRAQKMGNKPNVVIDVLYGQTVELLPLFLKLRGTKPGTLFLNSDGEAATGGVLYECVKRESQRLGIKTYFGQLPSCHTLRRTLATANADRLGMKLNPHEIAQRLRCGIDVAYEHYVQENVLLRSLKADEQRKQLACDPHREAQEHLDGLKKLGLPETVLDAVRAVVERKFAPPTTLANATWTLEDVALPKLQTQWDRKVNARMLRRYLVRVDAIDHGGERGRVRFRDDVLADLMSRDPIEVYTGDNIGRHQRAEMIKKFDAIRIGTLLLVRRDDGPQILRALRSRIAT